MYCGEMAAKLEEAIGVFFQVSVTLGILSAATMGLALNPYGDSSTEHLHLQRRLQYVIAVQWVVVFLILPVVWFMPESTLWLSLKEKLTGAEVNEETKLESGEKEKSLLRATPSPAPAETSNSLFRRDLVIPLLVGVALGSAQQLTGINAVMIYGPQLVGNLGLEPLEGNFYIMLWNFLTCLLSIPLVRRFSARKMYIGSTGVATVACLMTGLFVFPGILEADSTAQQLLSGAGVALFVAAFECGIGPCFYVLAQDIFPEEVRSAGTSYTIWVQFVFNVIINWGFPVAMTGFSGGPSGDQNQGMAICFMLFAGFGFVTTAFMALKMPKTNHELKQEALREEVFGTADTKAITNQSPVDIWPASPE